VKNIQRSLLDTATAFPSHVTVMLLMEASSQGLSRVQPPGNTVASMDTSATVLDALSQRALTMKPPFDRNFEKDAEWLGGHTGKSSI
jgi:hypothetical protein